MRQSIRLLHQLVVLLLKTFLVVGESDAVYPENIGGGALARLNRDKLKPQITERFRTLNRSICDSETLAGYCLYVHATVVALQFKLKTLCLSGN